MRACGLARINTSYTTRSFTLEKSGKHVSRGHCYAMGRRSEPTHGGDCIWHKIDDSDIKQPEVSLLTGNPPKKLLDDNAYVLFLRCKQAPPTPAYSVRLFSFLLVLLLLPNFESGSRNSGVEARQEMRRAEPSMLSRCLTASIQFYLWRGSLYIAQS